MANFYEAFAQGQANGLERQKAITQRNMLAELQQIGPQVIAGDLAATDRAYALDPQRAQALQAEGNRQQQQLFGLAKSLKQAAANPQMQAGIYRSAVPFLKRSFGAEIPDEFDATSVMPIVDQVLAVAENAPSMGVGGNVQSTYIDGNGNRVAILRDGSQRVLGPNNASIRVMEQEGALPYGVVTSGGRPGAVVDIGGGQAPMQGATGQYTIDPSLPPEVQQQIRAAEAAGQQVPSNMVLPARSGPVRVPTSAEKAAASEAGRLSVQQQYLPQELALRNQAALAQEAGKAQVSAQADANKLQTTRARDANTALDLLDDAQAILNSGATGSLIGAGADRVAGAFGRSTQGAQATAALQTIAGQLTSKMPRMEGPQSDRDVQLYKQMAGDLANDTLPVQTRLAALEQIRSLNRKYSNLRPSGSREQGAQRTIVRRGTSNGRPVVQYSDGTIEYGN
ncbi:D-Ala-D-Ala carboxypeptidase family metallohydrolase [Stenotrophomonas maltophilia]